MRRMSPVQRLVAILVGLIVVAGVAVLAVSLGDGGGIAGGGASPSSLASPTPQATETPSSSAAPTTPDDEEVLAALREIEEQVIAIRGLPRADIGDPDLITRDELGEELERLFEEDYPPEEQARDNAALRALGLLEPDQDVAELQLQLLGDQVLGFYDDVDRRMVVVTDAGLDAQAKLTYAHEYTHALQDAAFGLDSLETDVEGADDRGLARTALIEGDASVAMLAWAFANLSADELAEIGTTPLPDTSGIPSWMVAQLQFPYNEGLLWASSLAGSDPFAPDFDELDAAYADPPTSTEQIVHLEKWDPREEPDEVEVVDLAAALGEGWSEVDDTPVGEVSIRIMLEYFGVARDVAGDASDGWGGDRSVIVSGPDDAFAVAWRLVWDTPVDAEEFVAAYETAIHALDFPAVVTDAGDGEVLVVHGSSEEILRRALDAANG